jgi:hypothetical protein
VRCCINSLAGRYLHCLMSGLGACLLPSEDTRLRDETYLSIHCHNKTQNIPSGCCRSRHSTYAVNELASWAFLVHAWMRRKSGKTERRRGGACSPSSFTPLMSLSFRSICRLVSFSMLNGLHATSRCRWQMGVMKL